MSKHAQAFIYATSALGFFSSVAVLRCFWCAVFNGGRFWCIVSYIAVKCIVAIAMMLVNLKRMVTSVTLVFCVATKKKKEKKNPALIDHKSMQGVQRMNRNGGIMTKTEAGEGSQQ
ncbi:hypothetical protein BY458DRAFT_494502 [Sporodiniella umbellata]|nr:hypothetical protein BY458DRAFT_494502 [Sporodiniella umbellata]